MMNEKLKTRFPPSPTGLLHLGNVRTALFNALFAWSVGGVFLLRIEDTDRERSQQKYADLLQEDLKWLGLNWQEGPDYQSKRQHIYDKYYQQLEEKRLVYPCFCTEQTLAINRKMQRAAGKPPRYLGTCRDLSQKKIEEKLKIGIKAALRFRIPLHKSIVFNDLVRGEQKFLSDDIGDFIIRRADGTSPFMFCSAIDDALMGVTHVLRGEDHLTNTPRQLMILEALGFPLLEYGHISLIIGKDGSPLSKRHGSCSVQELRKQGFLPKAVINYLARLGHHYEENGVFSLEELANKFSINALGHAPARFDKQQLLHWQKEVVLTLSIEDFWKWVGSAVQKMVPKKEQKLFVETVQPNIVFPEDVKKWADIFYTQVLNFADKEKCLLKEVGIEFFEVALNALKNSGVDFYAVTKALKQQLNVKGRALFMPFRIALTGEEHGPELEKIFAVLGEEGIKKRLQSVVTALKKSDLS